MSNILRKHRKSIKKNKLRKSLAVIFTLILTTFAWFAYTKILNSTLDIHVAAWDMEYYINGEKKENPIGIEFPTLYPQMEDQVVTVDILNNGEALVDLSYNIQEISIAGVSYELVQDGEQPTTENYIEIAEPTLESDPETGELISKGIIINAPDKFPFTLEIEHSLQVAAQDDAYLKVTAKWPGDNDELDTKWGYDVGKYFMDNPDATTAMAITLSIESYQANDEIIGGTGILPNGPGTRPYLPSSDFTQVEGTTLETGLVIQDSSGNEYVWIEVPKLASVYPTAGISIKDFTDEEYQKIENDLHTYTATYRNGTSASDTYYTEDATGLSSSEYTELKQKMLKSVYQHGGFYISRYEAGTTGSRNGNTSIADLIPNSQPNQYPINWVTCSQAQELANKASINGYSGSLMFGIQWDLVQKYIEAKAVEQGTAIGTIQSQLVSTSTSWGNYRPSIYNITNESAQYSLNNGSQWLQAPYYKNSAGSTILTTGANPGFAKQNILDLAGNVWEWTLEYSNISSQPCVLRGGAYECSASSELSVNSRSNNTSTQSYSSIGFRITIY